MSKDRAGCEAEDGRVLASAGGASCGAVGLHSCMQPCRPASGMSGRGSHHPSCPAASPRCEARSGQPSDAGAIAAVAAPIRLLVIPHIPHSGGSASQAAPPTLAWNAARGCRQQAACQWHTRRLACCGRGGSQPTGPDHLQMQRLLQPTVQRTCRELQRKGVKSTARLQGEGCLMAVQGLPNRGAARKQHWSGAERQRGRECLHTA